METRYIGIDIHKEFSQVCVLDSIGNIVEECRVNSDTEPYMQFFRRYTGSLAVMESTGFWEYLYDALVSCGLNVVLSNPMKTKAIAEAKLKTDKVDARTLAHLLRTNMIHPSYIAPPEIRAIRDLIRVRMNLVRDSTRLKNRIHHELLRRGIKMKTTFRQKDVVELRKLGVEIMNLNLDLLEATKLKIKECDDKISSCFESHEEAQLLSSIPGIGKYASLLFFSEIVDIKRFSNPKKLASYVGMTPIIKQSAKKYRVGSISKQGSAITRWTLVECTHVHIRHCKDSVITKFYNRVYRRKGKKKAIVAAARKMIDVIYSVWYNKREFYTHKSIPRRYIVPQCTGL